eukprot:gene12831-3757_t
MGIPIVDERWSIDCLRRCKEQPLAQYLLEPICKPSPAESNPAQSNSAQERISVLQASAGEADGTLGRAAVKTNEVVMEEKIDESSPARSSPDTQELEVPAEKVATQDEPDDADS